MKRVSIGVLAHVDSGKTTLTEAMMYVSGNIKKRGRVDHGDSFLDTFSLERDRGITIFSKQAVMNCGDTVFTLLDTPGHVDFSAEAERVLQVLDYAVLVISGTDGVQSHTVTLWRLLRQYGIPCFLFVNKMDLPGTEKERLLSQFRDKLSENCVEFDPLSPDRLYEAAALCDESLFDSYDRTGSIPTDLLVRAICSRRLFPCLFGSALKLDGIENLLNCLMTYTAMPRYSEEFAGKVFKISQDPQGNRLTFLKVTGGSLKVKEKLQSERNRSAEKVNQIRIYSGERFTSVDEAPAGTVCAVTGISFARPGDGLGNEAATGSPLLHPVLTYSVILPNGADLSAALKHFHTLENEDPQLNVVWNERSSEIQLQLMGEIQLEVLQAVIRDRFGLEVSFGRGSIIYKETIAEPVEGIGHFEPLRHYAEVHLILKPGKRNSGLVFRSQCKEDQLDRNWQRLILTHLREKTHVGVLCGAPITDMEIILASGRAHPKHTEGGDFRQATYRAVRQGLRSAKSILLEPVYDFTLEVPQDNIGKAMSDIQQMYGSFDPPQHRGETAVLTGTAPVSTMREYTKEVLQYTHGKGSLILQLKGYEPCHNAEEVISGVGYDPENDVGNPCDSIFCSHGAGFTVKWDEVKSHMHLPSALVSPAERSPAYLREQALRIQGGQKDFFAADKELMAIFERTYGPVRRRLDSEQERFGYRAPEKRQAQKKTEPRFDGPEYLLIDGYNLIFSWEDLKTVAEENIDAARNILINILCNYQGYRKCELILVFDAYRLKDHQREVEKVNNIHIVYTKEAETADAYIEKVSHELVKNYRVRVVTSDRLEQLIIMGAGALRVSSGEFVAEIRQAEDEIREIISREYR